MKHDIDTLYVMWSSPVLGYGLFAKTFIKRGDIIGMYCGIVNFNSENDNTDYRWKYPTSTKSIHENCGIDARVCGNYLRFVNHDNEHTNVQIEFVSFENRWYLLYIAIVCIQKDCELFTNYGERYFASRE
jgi:SET domain-containing protein